MSLVSSMRLIHPIWHPSRVIHIRGTQNASRSDASELRPSEVSSCQAAFTTKSLMGTTVDAVSGPFLNSTGWITPCHAAVERFYFC
ncbi:hypothetical protein AJ78_00553 [Emergomyces pasteurianus Ep9510]|uniref:Uncharacterized protein n=1 Tax=Emergomyces pasteurianus Ep9510 TaxID=1447872 RepID=A0A1J9QW08_9EURO|nr:hypothetical protein AJ78_00553 [Emergomyces pasteurianus Ep9510]